MDSIFHVKPNTEARVRVTTAWEEGYLDGREDEQLVMLDLGLWSQVTFCGSPAEVRRLLSDAVSKIDAELALETDDSEGWGPGQDVFDMARISQESQTDMEAE